MALLKNTQSLPKCHIAKYISYKSNTPYLIKGIIASEPQLKNKRISFILRTQELHIDNLNYNCCGDILVFAKTKKDLHYGEELILKGNLYRPFSKKGSGRANYRDYLYHQGIFFIMQVKTDVDAVRLNKNKGLAIKRFALRLKGKIEGIISRNTFPIAASVLEAMILGEKRNIPTLIYSSMIKSGTVHILVVSGFNVGIIGFAVTLFLKLIRVPKKIRIIFAIPLLILYCLVTGASNPVLRATIMAMVFMSSYLIKREPDIYNSLSIAAIFILGVNPRQLFDIGFQLSFMSVIAIVYLYPKIRALLHIESLKIKYLKFLMDGCLVSSSAWLGTMGFIVYYFNIFSPITVLANIFIVPLATLITLCGFSLIVIGLIFPAAAGVFASTAQLLVALLLQINTLLIKLPGAYFRLT